MKTPPKPSPTPTVSNPARLPSTSVPAASSPLATSTEPYRTWTSLASCTSASQITTLTKSIKIPSFSAIRSASKQLWRPCMLFRASPPTTSSKTACYARAITPPPPRTTLATPPTSSNSSNQEETTIMRRTEAIRWQV